MHWMHLKSTSVRWTAVVLQLVCQLHSGMQDSHTTLHTSAFTRDRRMRVDAGYLPATPYVTNISTCILQRL
jgi:hypothetical protein